MLITVSPAKRLNEGAKTVLPVSEPRFLADAAELAEHTRGLSPGQLQKLMRISPALAELNAARFAKFKAEPEAAKTAPAGLMFAGDTYIGLEAATLDPEDMLWAQDHLRILSGLYGVLRPLDRIQPYRLEMGSRLANPRGATLYEFWREKIASELNASAEMTGTKVLINCASVEYFSAVDQSALKPRVITPVFMETRSGQAKIVSFYAKKARGAMARYIIERHLTDPEGLKDFDAGGYTYVADMSDATRWVFLRDTPQR